MRLSRAVLTLAQLGDKHAQLLLRTHPGGKGAVFWDECLGLHSGDTLHEVHAQQTTVCSAIHVALQNGDVHVVPTLCRLLR